MCLKIVRSGMDELFGGSTDFSVYLELRWKAISRHKSVRHSAHKSAGNGAFHKVSKGVGGTLNVVQVCSPQPIRVGRIPLSTSTPFSSHLM